MKLKLVAALFGFFAASAFQFPGLTSTNTIYAQVTEDCTAITNNTRAREECENKVERLNDPALDCDPSSTSDVNCNLFIKYLNPFIMFLSAAVGIAVTIGLVIGGIKYASAGADPGKVSAAQKQIQNSLLALVLYIFLMAILNWLVPGGVL